MNERYVRVKMQYYVRFSTWTHHHLTAIRYARVSQTIDAAVLTQTLQAAAEQDLQAAVIVNRKFLREEHVNVWNSVRATFVSTCSGYSVLIRK